jgi:CRISPR/Cas system endoribonuclease Cas6 (RAMP superfamily)
MHQKSSALVEIEFHMRDLRVAIRSGKLATTMEIVDKVAKLLDDLKDQEISAGYECFQIAKIAWHASDANFDNRQSFFLERHPVMQKYMSFKDTTIEEKSHNYDEYDWWDQIATNLIRENEIDHSGLVKSANTKRLQDSVQIRSYDLLKNIGEIVHFTPIENLPSIAKNGIVSIFESRIKNFESCKK